ncbi:MAG: TIM barrel protein [bacterium]|nr:TIM barrel protein [bacterium]
MIRYGLKLWSNNVGIFADARAAHAKGAFDFIELYYNPDVPVSEADTMLLKGVPVTIHATHTDNFHKFILNEKELLIWREIVALADFLGSHAIIVHPGRAHTMESFRKNLALIDDPRILIENMATFDMQEYPMFATTLDDLGKIRTVKPMCLDFEKAVKAARYLNIDYKKYIEDALKKLQPKYFHISGGDPETAIDEHRDLAGCGIDFKWVKEKILEIPGEIDLVFETPKKDGIKNDLQNMAYFRSL